MQRSNQKFSVCSPVNAVFKADKHRFQTIFNSMKEVYFEVDLKGYDLLQSCPVHPLGYTPEELMG
ncbi:MAG: hypothetical protein R2861_09875 [Desulfobacterales bacterium]